MKVTSIKRLMDTANNMGAGLTRANEGHIGRVQDRLNAGIDVHGNPFAPYKDPERYTASRPLSKAAHLFDDTKYSVAQGVKGVESTASIVGMAARIAFFQNVHRRFVGFSIEDRQLTLKEVANTIKEGIRGAQ